MPVSCIKHIIPIYTFCELFSELKAELNKRENGR